MRGETAPTLKNSVGRAETPKKWARPAKLYQNRKFNNNRLQ